MNIFKRTGALAVLLGSLWATTGFAQDSRPNCANFFLQINDPAFAICRGNLSAIPFDLLAPGARSLGLGGAFAAVADDATAAEANPAGQTILTRPEVSVHLRQASYDARFFDPNALDAYAFSEFNSDYAPVGPGPITGYDDSNTKISFLSFVYPFERFVLSAFYQNAGALQANTEIVAVESTFNDTYIAATGIDIEQESFGVSGAFRINDLFSIGASIKHSSLDLQTFSSSTVLDFRDLEVNFPGGGPYLQDEITLGSRSYGDDHDMTWNVGLLINPNGRFSGGIVYKKGGDYDVTNQLYVINIATCANAACDADNFVGDVSRKQTISLPNVLSFGLAWRPTDTWLVSTQIDRVDYGKLPNGSPNGFLFGGTTDVTADVTPLDTETVLHIGVEKTILFDSPVLGLKLLSLRAGGFTDPDHDSFRELDTDDTHYTFGLGTVLGEKLQVDLGAEFSDRVDAVVLSGVYHF